ncbi:M67 family metallopeptidase [Paenibacillus harenae]|uniref:M67 family metallopeptidase n=1 Tax=Paenibacillus harenae TaxID=306543 RepID=UPI0003F5C6C1|nr:M67 family metallopeptidase [Paenibacillus harenae]
MTEKETNGMITKEAYELLIRICSEANPQEACGILASCQTPDSSDAVHPLVIDTVIPIRNAHTSPGNAFSFDPAEWTRAYYDMQKNRQSLVGLFHSHPRTKALPSTSDADGFMPASSLSYWIVSLQDEENPQVQPYVREHGAFIPLVLVLA